MIKLAIEEIQCMIEHRKSLIEDVLDEAYKEGDKIYKFSPVSVSNVKMAACILWDLSQVMEKKTGGTCLIRAI